MNWDLKGKIVGISGASSQDGIGFSIAKNFLQNGAKVFTCCNDTEKLKLAEIELSKYGEVIAIPCDVSNEEEINNFFEEAMKKFEKLDVWINNAGIYPQKSIIEMTFEEWKKTINVNLDSVFLASKKAFSYMKENGGSIINAASFAAIIPSAGSAAYAATKSGVLSLTQTMAAEFAPYSIRVNAYIPGVIQTEMTQGLIDEKANDLLSQIALNKLGTPQNVSDAVLFLASEYSKYLTGTYINISGGKFCVQNPNYAF